MAIHKHPHSDLIDAVETTQVRLAFDLTPQLLYAWRTRGIPVARRVEFARIAAERGVEIPADFFDDLGFTPADLKGLAA